MTADPTILDRFRTLLREHDRRTIERCAGIAAAEVRRWITMETQLGFDGARAALHADSARRIEAAIRALADDTKEGGAT